jgi:hypothetical protein
MPALATAAPAPRNPRQIIDRLIAEVAREYPLRYTEDPAAAVDRLLTEVVVEYPAGVEVAR